MSTQILQNVDLILDRVKRLFNLRSDADLATFLGNKPGTISAWRSRKSIDLPLVLAKCREANAHYVVFGVGPKWADGLKEIDSRNLNQVNDDPVSYPGKDDKDALSKFASRTIAELESSGLSPDAKIDIAQAIIRMMKEKLAEIEDQERENESQDDQA
ncbi:MAG: hypothetical protein ABJ387_03685 [Balneola sp.]